MIKFIRHFHKKPLNEAKISTIGTIACISMFIAITQSFAQSSEITGRLLDGSQREVVYASVLLFQNDTTYVNSTISQINGDFQILNVEPGTYVIKQKITITDYLC